MIGQIELINALLCTYLIYKGYEIFQSAHIHAEAKKIFKILSIIAFIGSILLAIGFFLFMELWVDRGSNKLF
jgi:hypothetical protein